MGFNIRSALKNPITLWLNWLFRTVYFERKYADKKLKIGYMASVAGCDFGNYNSLHEGVRLCNVTMGDFSYVSTNSQITNATIGKFVSIGPEVICGLGKHPSRGFVSVHPVFYSPTPQVQITFASQLHFNEFSPIEIGNDVWLGARAIILDGIKIGHGAIVGAGAVVTKDVPPYAIVGGVPAKILRFRFEPDVIVTLLASKWWDRDIDWLQVNASKFLEIHEYVDNLKNSGKPE